MWMIQICSHTTKKEHYQHKRVMAFLREEIWLNQSGFEVPYTLYHTDKYMELAHQIVEVIVSPDTAIGFMHGIISVPVDLVYLTRAVLTPKTTSRDKEKLFDY